MHPFLSSSSTWKSWPFLNKVQVANLFSYWFSISIDLEMIALSVQNLCFYSNKIRLKIKWLKIVFSHRVNCMCVMDPHWKLYVIYIFILLKPVFPDPLHIFEVVKQMISLTFKILKLRGIIISRKRGIIFRQKILGEKKNSCRISLHFT